MFFMVNRHQNADGVKPKLGTRSLLGENFSADSGRSTSVMVERPWGSSKMSRYFPKGVSFSHVPVTIKWWGEASATEDNMVRHKAKSKGRIVHVLLFAAIVLRLSSDGWWLRLVDILLHTVVLLITCYNSVNTLSKAINRSFETCSVGNRRVNCLLPKSVLIFL